MRTALLVLAALATLGLSGCISGTAQTALPQTPAPAAPKDVHFLETLPLDNGAQKHYALDLAPGWTSAELTLKLVGSVTPVVHHESKDCVTYAAPFGNGQTGPQCPTPPGNVIISQSSPVKPGEHVLLHWESSQLTAGHYSINLDADSQVANIVFQVDVHYPAS